MRKEVLEQLNQAPMGMQARVTDFWSKMNHLIKDRLRSAVAVNKIKRNCNMKQWRQVMYYSSHFRWWDQTWNGHIFILVVNYYSRYWNIEKLYRTDATTAIKKITHIFSKMGLQEVVKSNNGPQFSIKFYEVCIWQRISKNIKQSWISKI